MFLFPSYSTISSLCQAESRLESEDSRTHHYLARQTAAPLRKILQDHLLTDHLSSVISMPNSGLDAMIDSGKLDDLARLYRIFVMVPTGPPTLKRAFKASIEKRGREINTVSQAIDGSNEEAPEPGAGPSTTAPKAKVRPQTAAAQTLSLALGWVRDILDLKDKFEAVWRDAFQKDRELESALNEVCDPPFRFPWTCLHLCFQAFESFINQNERCSEFISLFIDDNLKRGLKGVSAVSLLYFIYRLFFGRNQMRKRKLFWIRQSQSSGTSSRKMCSSGTTRATSPSDCYWVVLFPTMLKEGCWRNLRWNVANSLLTSWRACSQT